MSIQSKVQEALSAGVPQRDLTRILRNNAMKARDANIRGALMAAGQTAAGIASKNQAGLITQAGLGNQSFTPATGAQAALGKGAQQVGQAEAQYQGDLANIARQEFEDKQAAQIRQEEADVRNRNRMEQLNAPLRKEIKALEAGNKELETAIRQASTTLQDINAADAPPLIGAETAYEIHRKTLSSTSVQGIIDKYKFNFTTPGAVTGELFSQLLEDQAMEAVHTAVNAKQITSESAQAVTRIITALSRMATAALKAQGPGVKTNFDFKVAKETIGSLKFGADQFKNSVKAFAAEMQAQIDDNNKNIQELTSEMDGVASGFGYEPVETKGEANV